MHDSSIRWLVLTWLGKADTPENFKELAVPAGLAMLVLPFILFAVPAGFFADRFSKRTVIVGCKAAEIVLMLLGAATILYGNVWSMFFILFLMGTHSAIFGPSKYGSIPEIAARLAPGRQRLDRHDDHPGDRAGGLGAGYLVYWTKSPDLPLGIHRWWTWARLSSASRRSVCARACRSAYLKIANPRAAVPLEFRRRNVPRHPPTGGDARCF